MRPHTTESYEQWRAYNERARQGAEPNHFELNGVVVAYTTIHFPDGKKPFDYAVSASLPEGQAEYEITVSDDVPEDLRGLWAWHEYYEFRELGFEADNRCLRAEKIVTEKYAGTELYQKYLQYRVPFYQSVASYMAKDVYAKGEESDYTILDVVGAYSAMDYLDGMRRR